MQLLESLLTIASRIPDTNRFEGGASRISDQDHFGSAWLCRGYAAVDLSGLVDEPFALLTGGRLP